ncbi:MAG: laccase domain-containing protein [bacterium]|nr:laccase domain-containing protein [bacterium]
MLKYKKFLKRRGNNMLHTNIKYFHSMIVDGNMNLDKKFYPEGMNKEEIKADFTMRRIKLGRELGFDGLKILTPIQKKRPDLSDSTEEEKQRLLAKYDTKYMDGHAVRITRDMIDSYEDLYDIDIDSDILMIDSTLPEIALAYPVADSPVVFAEDTINQVVAMAHCGGEYIDRGLAGDLIEQLRGTSDCHPDDISVYIGPHAQAHSYTYDCFPKFVKNGQYWTECLTEQDGFIHINMAKAIIRQLEAKHIPITNIHNSDIDTITNPNFYSNNRARFDQNKDGRFYTGCFYQQGQSWIKTRRR